MFQSEILVELNQYVSSRSAPRDEPEEEPKPREPADPEAEVGPGDDSDQLPENVPDDWLDPKPFDPAGR